MAPSGSDSADGSMATPVHTLKKAIALAKANAKDVYVCNGTYTENVVIDADDVALFGGYDCDNGWSRSHERAVVAPAQGVPLRIDNVNGAFVDHLELVAPPGVAPGESSIAGAIVDSTDIVLNRSAFIAANGANGKAGAAAAAVTTPAMAGAQGTSIGGPYCSIEPFQGECTSMAMGGQNAALTSCAGGAKYRGGYGGTGANYFKKALAKPGVHGYPLGGSGGALGSVGGDGSAGSVGAPGEPGGAFGSIVNGAYISDNDGTDGGPGTSGLPGGGGAGGLSDCTNDICMFFYLGGGGGQGGYPGCGGDGGLAGEGGGASIALIVEHSLVSASETRFETASGGNGGNGSAGAAGQPGGSGGKGGSGHGSYQSGKNGGKGGNGGNGGAGGPGGGGPSIAVLTVASAPTLTAVTFQVGTPGTGGKSGVITGSTGKSGTVVEAQ